ncbi:MAG: DNA polymerase III subunit delta [Pseudomonadota bacterium]
MRINSDQLAPQLQKQLLPMYWIAGDETLVVQETLDKLRARCRQQGFSEWELFFVDRSFNWQTMLQSGNSLSLFSDKKIIELRLYSAKLEDEGREALQQYLADPNPDNVLIIVSPRLETSAFNTKWFKVIETAGVFVQVWPVDGKELPRWISTRMAQYGMSADAEAIAILSDRLEGNLLAASQEIEKLRVLTGATPENKILIDRKQIMNLVADNSRYNTFNLMDAALLGNARHCLKILNGLRAEGSEVLALLGMLTRELRILHAVATRMSTGQSVSSAMQNEGVRKNHEGPVSAALERHSVKTLEGFLQQSRRVDLAVKGLHKSDPWTELTTVLLGLCGVQLCIAQAFSGDL